MLAPDPLRINTNFSQLLSNVAQTMMGPTVQNPCLSQTEKLQQGQIHKFYPHLDVTPSGAHRCRPDVFPRTVSPCFLWSLNLRNQTNVWTTVHSWRQSHHVFYGTHLSTDEKDSSVALT